MRGFLIISLVSVFLFSPLSVWAEDPDPVIETTVAKVLSQACEGHLDGKMLAEAQSKWSGKTVVLDTNVILNDPYAFYKYPGAEVIIPITVIEEADEKKIDLKTGKAARTFFKALDEVIGKNPDPQAGISLPHGARLVIEARDFNDVLKSTNFNPGKKDNQILALTKHKHESLKTEGRQIFLISDDRAVRVKAASLGVAALPFEYEWVTSAQSIENQFINVEVGESLFDEFLSEGKISRPEGLNIAPNQFVMLRSPSRDGSPETVARFVYDRENPKNSGLRRLTDFSKLGLPFGPMNLEQHMALDVLFDPTVELVIMEAFAGTGKTFVTLLAALSQLNTSRKPGGTHGYGSLMITRPLVDVGRQNSLGALPGDKAAKLEEDFNAFYDNLSLIWAKMNDVKPKAEPPRHSSWMDQRDPNDPMLSKRERRAVLNHQREQQRQKEKPQRRRRFNPSEISNLDLLPFTKMRGRSLHDMFVIADEFQNTSIHEAKTMLTRVGEGSKIVILGDATQIDVNYLNERNNGLSVSANLFTADSLSEEERSHVAFVKLKEGVRSALAKLSAKVFENPHPEQ